MFLKRKNKRNKRVLRYFRRKKRLSRLRQQVVQKVEKLGFFQRGQSIVLDKNWKFLKICILGKIGQENNFQDILEGRNASPDYKNKKLKMSKNWGFSIGVSPSFSLKIGNFSRFVFQGKQARKTSFTIFQKEETPFQTIKTKS